MSCYDIGTVSYKHLDVYKRQILKVAVYHRGSIRQLGEEVLIPQWGEKVQTCVAGEEWVDFMDASVDKGNALRILQDYFGVSREETMAFGDNTNDIGLMKAAGLDVYKRQDLMSFP